MFPADRDPRSLAVEYDYRGRRARKSFADTYQARRFYVGQARLGRNPKVYRSETMTTEVTPTETPAAETQTNKTQALAKKRTAKKAAAKKAVKKATKKAAKKASPTEREPGERAAGARKTSGLPAAEKRARFLKALKQLGAVSATTAVPAAAVVKRDGKLTPFDVYCQGYHKNELATDGLIKLVNVEGTRGLAYHLTAKGQKEA